MKVFLKVFHACSYLDTLRIFSRLIGIIDLEKKFEARPCIPVQYRRKRKYGKAFSRNLILGVVLSALGVSSYPCPH